MLFTYRDTEDIFEKLRSLRIKFTPGIVVEILADILEAGKAIWGVQQTVGKVLAHLPDEMAFNDLLRRCYRHRVKMSFVVELAMAPTKYLSRLVDILKELYTRGFFESPEILDVIDGSACYIFSYPSSTLHLLRIVEALQPIYTSRKYKECCRVQLVQITKMLSESTTSKAFSPENRTMIAKTIEVLHVSADDLLLINNSARASDEIKSTVENIRNGSDYKIVSNRQFRFCYTKLDAEYFLNEIMQNKLDMDKCASFVYDFKSVNPKGHLFQDHILEICQAGVLNQLQTVSEDFLYLAFLGHLRDVGVMPLDYFYDELDAVLLEKNLSPEEVNKMKQMFPRPVKQNPAPTE